MSKDLWADALKRIDEELSVLKAIHEAPSMAAGADADQEISDLRAQLATADQTIRSLTDLLDKEHENVKKAQAAAAELGHANEIIVQDAYVPVELPWSDVAAGMMTIAKDGTPWMVQDRVGEQVFLRNGEKSFPKDPQPGETVRVLVSYVTPEQAADLVRDALGGVPVATNGGS